MKKLLAALVLLIVLTTTTFAQNKPIRIGLKFGVPNIAGLNLEYVSPLFGGRLALSGDASYISLKISDVKYSFSYLELGTNIYFIRKGKGLYGNLSYGRIGLSGTYDDPTYGKGKGSIGLNNFNIKIGGKWGGIFYFRPEIGYRFLLGDSEIEVEYETITQKEKVPGIAKGGIILNVGFGLAF